MGISIQGKLILIYIKMKVGDCSPGAISDHCGIPVKTVRKNVLKMIDLGVLSLGDL